MNLVHDLSFFTQNHYFLLEAIKEVSEYKCPNCNKQFKDRSNYHKHMKLYETTKYSCDKCDKSYTAKGNLNQYIKTHDIPEIATCSKCKKVFATITSYKIHMKNVDCESKEDIAQVTHFSIMYRTFADITAQNNCTEPEELKCNFCLKSFSNKGNLKRHKEKIHEVEKETDTSKKVHVIYVKISLHRFIT